MQQKNGIRPRSRLCAACSPATLGRFLAIIALVTVLVGGWSLVPARAVAAEPIAAAPAQAAPVEVPPGHLAYVVAKPGVQVPSYDLYVSRLDGSEQRLLWEWGRQPQFRQSDGRLILNADGPEKGDLWTVNLDGSNPIQVSTHPEDAHPNWCPNPVDERILYDSQFYVWGRDNQERIWTIWTTYSPDLNSQPVSVTVADRVVPGRCPVWLDNGWVVYSGCNFWEGGGSCGLYTVPVSGDARARQLTTAPEDLPGDAWGDWVLYTGVSTGNWDVYKVNFSSGEIINLTNAAGSDGMPAFSPDGTRVAFVSDRDHTWSIWIMNADGSNPQKAFPLPGSLGRDWVSERISWGP